MKKNNKEFVENIIKTEYSEVMEKSFIDYAMSVITARALPDARDGLKPVQRRVLYDMHELGLKYDRPYRKSARIVGDTMGKYHPHGDSSIYESLVVMSQDFKKGQALVDGHGNFGNIEGDGAAAMRYTEARLEQITQEAFLSDLDKDVVDFIPNFDETEKEPSVLPVRFPNLLVNGSDGIAVGMVTSIPPHNLGEIIDATKAYMRDEDISVAQLLKYINGPDFPTGGIVTNKDDLKEIYETGVGKIKIRGKVDVEPQKNGKTNVVISEIPYTMIGANIAKFLIDVAALSESKKTQDIVDITNQSSKEGIRIVIELRKDADVDNFINLLYKKTRLEDTFGVNMLAILDGRPEVMSLKQIIASNVEFQYEIARRKYTKLLADELDKKEIQEGLIKACNVIDLIIEILRGSKDRAMAKKCLVEGETGGIKFKSAESEIMATQLSFTDRQADAILNMRLYKLIGLEIEALINDHEDTLANIFRYEDILERKESMAQVIINDLDDLKSKFSRKRRTVIDNVEEAVYVEKEIEEMEVIFLMDRFGYAKTIDKATYERNKDSIATDYKYVVNCKNTGCICIFTNIGNMHTVKVKNIPFGKYKDKGVPIDNISNYDTEKEFFVSVESQSRLNMYKLIFATKMGMLKVVDGGEFDVTRKTITCTKLLDNDEIISVDSLQDQKQMVMISKEGYFLRFGIEEIPEKKKGAVGVRGIKLGPKDAVEMVAYTTAGGENIIEYHDLKLDLMKVKLAKRDGKGTKMRL